MEIESPPFLLCKEKDVIVLRLFEDQRVVEKIEGEIIERAFRCLSEKKLRNDKAYNCHGFMRYLEHGGDPIWFEETYDYGKKMDMADARKKFGFPFGIVFECEIMDFTHSALVIGQHKRKPVIIEKPGKSPLNVNYLIESKLRQAYPKKPIRCYPLQVQ